MADVIIISANSKSLYLLRNKINQFWMLLFRLFHHWSWQYLLRLLPRLWL